MNTAKKELFFLFFRILRCRKLKGSHDHLSWFVKTQIIVCVEDSKASICSSYNAKNTRHLVLLFGVQIISFETVMSRYLSDTSQATQYRCFKCRSCSYLQFIVKF